MAKIEDKAVEIVERLAAELDAIGCEYQIAFGRNSDEEEFGKMAFSDNFNVDRAIASLEMTLEATKKLKNELETPKTSSVQ